MKKIILAILILLVVFSVACQPKAKVVPTPDMVESVPVKEAGVSMGIDNENLNESNHALDLENYSLEEYNNS